MVYQYLNISSYIVRNVGANYQAWSVQENRISVRDRVKTQIFTTDDCSLVRYRWASTPQKEQITRHSFNYYQHRDLWRSNYEDEWIFGQQWFLSKQLSATHYWLCAPFRNNVWEDCTTWLYLNRWVLMNNRLLAISCFINAGVTMVMVCREGDALLYRGSHDQLPPLQRTPARGVTWGGSLWFTTSSSRNSLNCVIYSSHPHIGTTEKRPADGLQDCSNIRQLKILMVAELPGFLWSVNHVPPCTTLFKRKKDKSTVPMK